MIDHKSRRNTVVRILLVAIGLAGLALQFAFIEVATAAKENPESTPQRIRPVQDLESIRLEGQPNFRDLGGYLTDDGRRVKRGIIFRSGEFPDLSDEDLEKLEQLEIKVVLNFLTDKEIKAYGADRLPDGVEQIHRPIESDVGELAQTIRLAIQNADFAKVPPDLNPEIHRLLVTDATARTEYAYLLRLAADERKHPLVFHCSHGIHRTGTGAAILLWTLGVPWETIRQDYLLSNTYRKDEIQTRLEQLRQQAAKRQGIEPEQVDMTSMEAFYVLQASYIDAARDEILKQYGSIDRFVKEGLGLKEEEITKLREQLLEE